MQTGDATHISDHDGEEIDFMLQEDRLLSVLGRFRHSFLPTARDLFQKPSRFGHKAFAYGTDFSLREIVKLAAINRSWLKECVRATFGQRFLQVNRLIDNSVTLHLHHEIQDGTCRFTGDFSGRVSRFLSLGRLKPPLPTLPCHSVDDRHRALPEAKQSKLPARFLASVSC